MLLSLNYDCALEETKTKQMKENERKLETNVMLIALSDTHVATFIANPLRSMFNAFTFKLLTFLSKTKFHAQLASIQATQEAFITFIICCKFQKKSALNTHLK